ncbi:TrmH family RNA methyltransferase [Ureaplasma parvum]|uniref:rRNA methyltransferase n=1 Tax=Ureaplasma parvum TaxID=134821 RepID=A0AAC9X6I8_UREPR|nr:RNA methyltransferase [Ureaplasma parvum]ASD25360.1 rRNA methyltransferase [Ureaplasma parvum]ASD28734.1 rRNA methyltransferase [Ureaplasma parvum]ASD30002.1 rRNA methyltransferase [Ureaplasma parvum]MDU4142043.1 RNA methyltransferase [Ureaplasma parvum]BBD81509.1 rRNA methylase [Ureaplasma parvum serovar 3]
MLKIITSNKNEEIIHFYRLIHDKKYREANKLFIIEGFKLLDEALQNQQTIVSIIVNEHVYNKEFETIFKYTLYDNIQIYKVSGNIIKKLSVNIEPSPILAVVKIKQEMCDINDNILLLDNIQDPGNLGTILRTCFAFNIKQVIFNNCVDLYNPKTIKASMGAIFKINFLRFNDSKLALNFLLKNKFYLIATILDKNAISLNEITIKQKYCLMVGNEGHGLVQTFIDHAHIKTMIKMNQTESLNVAVAAAIFLYELNK